MDDDELDYQTHAKRCEELYGGIPEHLKDFVVKRAQYDHALRVFNPLGDLQIRAGNLASRLRSKDASYYMLHGAARRLGMIWQAYRAIIFTVPPDRDKPLTSDEASELNRDINIIYMHLRGVLDNFAWCLVYEKEPSLLKIHPGDIGLSSKKMRESFSLNESWTQVAQHGEWMEDVKSRRDPVAHRIPLHVMYSVVTQEESKIYKSMYQEFLDAASKMDFDRANDIFTQLHEIGRFMPYFIHHPEDDEVPIYPTIPNDMVHLIKIYGVIEHMLTK